MPVIHPAIACNVDAAILSAALPLLEAEKVAALEWSFDALFQTPILPGWFTELLHAYGNEGRLLGHGVYFSLFSGRWSAAQQAWLRQLKKTAAQFRFDHITEHFGFMTGADFHQGAPLSIPCTPKTLAIGQDRLKRVFDACQCPVGIENLAFSYALDDVKKHGAFLEALVEPVNGFIILDLHNLYCQLHNFNLSYEVLVASYPLHRVREIHISGGSWERSVLQPEKKIRRDTHDDRVPEEVFWLLQATMPRCPNLKYVVLEQIGTSLVTEKSRKLFQEDFSKLHMLVHHRNSKHVDTAGNDFLPAAPVSYGHPVEDEELQAQQAALSAILETATTCEEAQQRLQHSALAHTDWAIENWQPAMLETAVAIAQKWKHGFENVAR